MAVASRFAVEKRIKLVEKLRNKLANHDSGLFAKTEAIPGSPEKIEVLRERYAANERETKRLRSLGKKRASEEPLDLATDARMPIGKGWRLRLVNGRSKTAPNGRTPMCLKELVDLSEANAAEVARRERSSDGDLLRYLHDQERDHAKTRSETLATAAERWDAVEGDDE